MRVTNNMMSNNMMENILKNLGRLYETQDQLSSGKKISRPSDNPTDINRVMRFNEDINRMDQYLTNINTVKVGLDTSDGVLFALTNDINSIEVSLSRYSNSALSGDYDAVLASDVDNVLNSILKIANTSVNGRYIFGGQNVKQAPFEMIGDKIKYHGTDDQLLAMVGNNETLEASVTGVDIFSIHRMEGIKYMNDPDQAMYSNPSTDQIKITVGETTTDITIGYDSSVGMTLQDVVDSINRSGVDVNALIEETDNGYRLKLISHYLGNDGKIILEDVLPGGVFEKLGMVNSDGDFVGIQNNPQGGVLNTVLSIKNKMQQGNYDIGEEAEDLVVGRDNVIKAHALVGIYTKRLEQREEFLGNLSMNQKSLKSLLEDVDYAELMMEYNQQMLAYQSSMNVGAKIMNPTLLDYL